VVRARLGDLAVTAFEFEQRCTQVDIALNLYENPDGSYLGRFQFSTELFTTPTVERMSRNFLHLLNEIVRNPAPENPRNPAHRG